MTANSSFSFRAVHRNGALESGVVEAPSREAAVAAIGRRGVFAIEVSPEAHGRLPRLPVAAQDLAAGLRALAVLLSSGTPIARALQVLQELVPPTWLTALPIIRDHIGRGSGLAAALEGSSLPLPPHVIGIVKAGEAGSGLAAAVDAAANLLEERAEMQAAARNALAYPIMLAIGGSASVGLLVGVVLPRFAGLLADAGHALPLSTRFVLQLGSLVQAALVPGACTLACALMLWRVWVARPAGLAQWHKMLLAAPAVGPLRRSMASANACAALASLLAAGVPLLDALPHAAKAAGDLAAESRLLAARHRIERGERIATALQLEGALTPGLVQFVGVGEESGQLARMLSHAARIESTHASQQLRRLIRIVEPIMILLFGGVVMMVAAALFQAMYGLRPAF